MGWIRWAALIALFYALYLLFKPKGEKKKFTVHQGGGRREDVMVQCPQCGTYTPKYQSVMVESEVYKGAEPMYFCSETCRDRYFEKK